MLDIGWLAPQDRRLKGKKKESSSYARAVLNNLARTYSFFGRRNCVIARIRVDFAHRRFEK